MLDESGVLICPNCGESNLHHDRVTVYARADGGEAKRTVVESPAFCNEETRRRGRIPKNASDQRSGLVVEGCCEHCPARWRMTVAQHKGTTFVKVESEP